MPIQPRVSRAGIELVKRFEGLRRTAARLREGGWTIGYGHTRSAREGATVTAEEAEALLIYDLRQVSRLVQANVYTPLNQNQFDALCAFAFNIGEENFLNSAVLKRLNEGSYLQAASALELWRKAEFAGEDLVIDALVRRRAAEKALFLTPPDDYRPTPTPVVRVLFDPSILESMEQSRPSMDPVVLNASLEGALATLERQDPPLTLATEPQAEAPLAEPAPFETGDGSAALAAAAGVKARLERLFADEPAPAAPAVVDPRPDLAFPPPPVAPPTAEPTFATAPDPEPPPPPFAAIEPSFAPAAPAPAPSDPEPQPEPEVASEGPSEPNLFDPLAAFARPAETPVPVAEEGGFGRRNRPIRYAGAPRPGPGRRGNRAPYHPLMLIVALLGVALFSGSIVAMLTGKATFAMLGVGIVGIILMAPAGIRFLLNRLEEEPTEKAPE